MLTEKARVAVLISGGGTNLEAVLRAQAAGMLPSGEVMLVVSSRGDAYGLERARRFGVETAVLSRAMEPDRGRRNDRLLALLEARAIDAVVLAGYLDIVGDSVIGRYPGLIINVHPSLIPAFSGPGMYGLKVHEAALARGVRITGATVHVVDGEVDGGPILLQRAVEVRDGDTPESLQRRVMEEAEWQLLPRAAEIICARALARRAANEMERVTG